MKKTIESAIILLNGNDYFTRNERVQFTGSVPHGSGGGGQSAISMVEPMPWADYDKLTESGIRVSSCIGCGQCENVWPQHISIIDTLKECSRIFDA